MISASVSARYASRIAAGEIEADPAQQAVVEKLARLETRIADHRLGKFFSLGWPLRGRARAPEASKGIYMFGDVGRGKTMLMDLFFDSSSVTRKRRVHFHEFMAEVHERIHVLRQRINCADDRSPAAITSRSRTSFTPFSSIVFR